MDTKGSWSGKMYRKLPQQDMAQPAVCHRHHALVLIMLLVFNGSFPYDGGHCFYGPSRKGETTYVGCSSTYLRKRLPLRLGPPRRPASQQPYSKERKSWGWVLEQLHQPMQGVPAASVAKKLDPTRTLPGDVETATATPPRLVRGGRRRRPLPGARFLAIWAYVGRMFRGQSFGQGWWHRLMAEEKKIKNASKVYFGCLYAAAKSFSIYAQDSFSCFFGGFSPPHDVCRYGIPSNLAGFS